MYGNLPFEYPLWVCVAVTAFGIFLIGIAKAGFGGGVGFLTTPLLSLFMPPRFVIGVLLPLLIFADAFVVWIYWRDFAGDLLRRLLIGAALGIALGTLFISRVDDLALRRAIGVLALLFLALQRVRDNLGEAKTIARRRRYGLGIAAGLAAGFVSMVAHSAGVIVAMYLLTQDLRKRSFWRKYRRTCNWDSSPPPA